MRLFTERELKLIALVVGAATVLSVAVAVIVSLSRPRGAVIAESHQPGSGSVLSVSDLAVPDELAGFSPPEWYPFRPRLARWNEEQIRRFWIDPAEIELDRLAEKNDHMIQRLFENIP